MNFDFQQMKPVIQQDFDAILDAYPTDLSHIEAAIPTGGDAYERKRILVEKAAAECPVHLFAHYPFAFELDVGEVRDICYQGIGNRCRDKSGVDFSALLAFCIRLNELNVFNGGSYTDPLHNTLDHDLLLQEGFRGAYERCERLNADEPDEHKRHWRGLVMTCCRAVETVGLRLRALAREMLPTAQDEDARYNLQRIADSVNTPWEPAATMFDALNSILCTTVLISGLDGVEMNAYGQIDRLIQPFYERDLAAGRITRQEADFLLRCFLHKTDMHCHFNEQRNTRYDNGTSVMIGGCDLEGRPVYNEITRMVLEAYTDNKLINPKLNARASADSPREYIEALAALLRTGNNNLVIENDDYIIPMFERMGLSPQDARTYVGNGCQEVICRNQLHSRAFIYLNLAQILLDTLHHTAQTLPAERQAIYRYGSFAKADYAQLHASFLTNLRSVIRVIAEQYAPYERLHPTICPEPMHSAFTADCVAKGQDLAEGGARYNHKTISLVGFGTLCDSLLSLRRAYAAGKQEELTAAVAVNFEGSEPLRQTLIKSKDRFGHSEAADAFARTLADELAQVSRGMYNAAGIEWRTSLFTYLMYVPFGNRNGATPDGRLAGEVLSRQMDMAAIPAMTDAARSMAVLSDADFNDVGVFDQPLPLTVTDSDSARSALTDYIRTCIALRLPVLQFNVADVQTMREERAQKGTHPDLVVRVCGYSAIFGELYPVHQDEIIARAEG